ncbi:MAG: phosphoribosylglycinamide formyltransferase [Chloroflexota bacterium]|nr:phosphoribosylglycinamide formyltransferase [Chloroflexota bacterium]
MSAPSNRIIVLISGGGTNLQALIDAIASGDLTAVIALVIANRKAAYGLTRADIAGIPTHYAPLKPYTDAGRSREAYDADLARAINAHQPDLVVLAGWMHIFTPAFLDTVSARVINLHPALPGMFPGAHGIRDQYDAFQRGEIVYGGCMVHDVIAALDAGQVIGQSIVPIADDDSFEAFAERLHAAERLLLLACVRQVLASHRGTL